MLKIFSYLIGFIFIAATGYLSAKVEINDAETEKKFEKITKIVTETVSRHNFKQTPLDDELSAAILDTYLNDLDPNRSYFLEDDIQRFSNYSNNLDDALAENDLTPAFTIFNRYREQVNNQVSYALDLLKSEFDFNIDEEYQFDRVDEPWAKSQDILDETWRKRVKNDYLGLKLAGEKDDVQIRESLTKNFETLSRRTNQLNNSDVYQLFINAYTASVEPHTSYFSPRTSENFKIRMSLSLEGIGAVLEPENEYTKVRRVVAGGPAATSEQLNSGDRIVGVGQDETGQIVEVIGWRLDDVVDLIRGPKGTTVRLKILPKGAAEGMSKTIAIVRDKIKLEEQAAKKEVLKVEDSSGVRNIGVITLPTFYSDFDARQRGDKDYRSTTRDVKQLLQSLEEDNVDGIILDLRNNGGGSLTEANELTGLFIKSGPVVQVLQTGGKLNINRDPDPNLFYSGPLAVLVDRNSASASEILTGAIQDYKRGIVIGEPTFGKGTVQNLIDLNQFNWNKSEPLGQLKMTIAQFFRVNGDSTQHRGVIPDIVYPTAFDIEEHGERALENAIPWAKVSPARYQTYDSGIDQSIIDKLKSNHEVRIKQDPGFHFILSQSRSDFEIEKQKTVSLIEQKRQERTDQINAQRLARYNLYRVNTGQPEIDKETYLKSLDEDSELDFSIQEDILLNEAVNILSDFLNISEAALAAEVPATESNIN